MQTAILMPSRGIHRAEVVAAAYAAAKGYDHKFFRSRTLPLPACFNDVTERAMAWSATHFLFIEEDVIVPSNAIEALLALDADIAALNYEVRGCKDEKGNQLLSDYHFNGKLLWVSMGCLLVRRSVFEQLDRPWFRNDIDLYTTCRPDGTWKFILLERDAEIYGGQDINFCYRAAELGFRLAESRTVFANHLDRVRPRGEAFW